MTTRSTIIERIVKLRALCDGTGSEAEAMAAMKAADKLMQGYRIEEAELAMAEIDGTVTVDIVHDYSNGINAGRNRHKVQVCLWEVERYCEVEVVIKNRSVRHEGQYLDGPVLHWIGDRADVEMAKFLVALIRDALDTEYARWKRSAGTVGRAAKANFQLAMAARINSRLRQMGAERDSERCAAVEEAAKLLSVDEATQLRDAIASGRIAELTSTALVVVSAAEVKAQAVADEFKAHYANAKLRTASSFSYRRGAMGAAEAGRAAGDRVNLGRPVGQARAAGALA